MLGDEHERAAEPYGISGKFGPFRNAGYLPAAAAVPNHVDIEGFFQSSSFYDDAAEVRRWFTFRPEIVDRVRQRYPASDTISATSISLRLDADYAGTREYFPLYPVSFYARALARVHRGNDPILVFADRIDLARPFLRSLHAYNMRFVDDLSVPEQLCLMTMCASNVIVNSTFSWWGAWLNTCPGHHVVAPSHWCRPGIPVGITDILCDDWIKVAGTVPVWDHFQVWRLRHPVATIKRIATRLGLK